MTEKLEQGDYAKVKEDSSQTYLQHEIVQITEIREDGHFDLDAKVLSTDLRFQEVAFYKKDLEKISEKQAAAHLI